MNWRGLSSASDVPVVAFASRALSCEVKVMSDRCHGGMKQQESSTSKMSIRATDTHLLILLLLCHLSRLILLLGLFAALLQLLLILLDDRFFLLGKLFLLLLLSFGFLVDDGTCEATICQMRRTRVEEVLLASSECG